MAKVKICGLSTTDTMQAALDAGADFVGLVFFAKSPRNVSLQQAKKLAAQARGRAFIVALVVDADDVVLTSIVQAVSPDYIQLHGTETVARIAEISALTKTPIIKAIKVEDVGDIASATAFKNVADIILFDAKAPKEKLPGGNGLSFDWTLLKTFEGPFMLSGGLDPQNVGNAIKLTGAVMVDVSSGVEAAPGIKDALLIAKFIKAAKLSANEDNL
jgi:phosphoribosylanthranilate isomerase